MVTLTLKILLLIEIEAETEFDPTSKEALCLNTSCFINPFISEAKISDEEKSSIIIIQNWR